MSQYETKLKSQAGQGTVELILVLLVSVSIVLGVAYQLNDAFGNWAKNYFGEYVSCLLESGELPSLGGSGGVSAAQCNDLFEPFSIANGRPLIGAGVGEGGGQGGNSAGRSGPGGPSGGQARGRRSGGANNVFGGRTSFRSKSRFTPKGGGGGSKGTYTGSTDGDISGLLGGRNKKIRTKRRGFRAYDSIYYADEKKKKLSAADVKKRKSLSNEGEVKQRAVRIPLNRKLATKKQMKADLEMTFGDYLKYIIIIAIIIALVLFFGNQAMQISKSME